MVQYIHRNLFLVAFFITTVTVFSQVKPVVSVNKAQTSTLYPGAVKPNGAQNSTNDLKKLEEKFNAKYKERKEHAIAYALIHNVPIRKTLEDGGFAELQYVAEDGSLIYFRTYNSAAAESTRADWLNTGGGMGLTLNGDGLTAHVWDGGHARITHQDYDGPGGANRVSLMDTASEGGTQLNFHAAHVTGTIMATGVGNFNPPYGTSKGMAWQSDVRGYMWNNDVAEATSQANDGSGGGSFNFGYDMLLSNHSYGYGAPGIPDAWFGQYGSDAVDWDTLMYNAPYYLMVVAAGNDGNDNTSNGNPLNGNANYDKLSGHATAKNNLVVANANDATINPDGSLNSVLINTGSSEGPTDDYRIKPDITGNGTSLASTGESADDNYIVLTGTSMASPNVTGTLLLLQEHYENIHNVPMRASTLKGLALHTADDPNANGPDVVYGWGLLNAKKAAETVTIADASGNAEVVELTLNQGQIYTVNVQASGTEPLFASISWTDPAGTQNNGTNSSTPALVNDLDLNLDNGTTFYPWRLTGITANSQNNENNVDPFERVDITGASGLYTLTVSHDGTLSSGSQDFALVITGGQIVAGAPQIAFGTASGTATENSECSFTDINVPLNITTGASANADVDFSINASSTAATGRDFDLMTASVTFPAGSTVSQNMVLRIYEDAFTEGDETIVIDFTVDDNGGDAEANPALDTYTLTITNDDSAPVATINTTVFSADFQETTGWTVIDNDGDTEQWSIFNPIAHGNLSGNWAGSVTDLAIVGETGILTPDNFISSPQFSIPLDITSATLTFEIGDLGAPENYTVYFTTDKSSVANITSGTQLESRTVTNGVETETRTIDVSGLAGETGYLSFRHHAPHGDSLLMLDTIDVTIVSATNVQTAVNSGSPDSINLNGLGTAYSEDTTTDNIMVSITNNQNDDFGCTDVTVSRAGTGSQAYNGSTGMNEVMDKRFTITPTTTVVSPDVSLTFYIDATELAGWETASSNPSGSYSLYIARESGGTLQDVIIATVGNFGAHTILTGNFSGIDGDFYFGRQEAFISCTGLTKTWDGISWSPVGAPDSTNAVIITGDYNTSNGNIEACELTINETAQVTVRANEYLNIQGNITVDGTLIIEHQGSVVQVNPSATVTKNPATGIINVNITTPVLQTRDFMVMGSPMDTETRNGVFVNAFLVLDHAPNNFNPNTHPNIPQGATNFSDLEGDLWTTYTGVINPGEGYIVRPQSGYGDPAGITYDMTYSAGTLTNGTVSRPMIYNNINSPAGTPNAYANPYASAIDADQFIQDNGLNALYFWEHLTPPSVIIPGEGLKFDMDDVSVRNFGGGVAANNDNPLNIPNGVISTGQGFAIKATTNSTVSFTNTMRLATGNTTLRTNELAIDRLWLHLESDTYGLANNLLIGFNPAASNAWDNGYDTDRLASSVGLYSHLDAGDEQMSIQTRGAFASSDKIQVGFSSLIEEQTLYTISLSNIEGSNLSDRAIYLYDTYENTLTDLTQGDYAFRSNKATNNRRFTVTFEPDNVLAAAEAALENISMFPNPTSDVLNISSPTTTIESIKVYDVRGRVMTIINTASVQRYQLDMSRLGTAMYFVEITTAAGKVTKRVVRE